MQRSRKILIVAHCVLNANSKIQPYACCAGVNHAAIAEAMANGVGIFQLPCPENGYLGMKRWGMTREQYDTPGYRAHCRAALEYPLREIANFAASGYEIVGVMGIDGSPSCGMNCTCEGFCGGEIGHGENIAAQTAELREVKGMGVFMEELQAALQRLGINAPRLAVKE